MDRLYGREDLPPALLKVSDGGANSLERGREGDRLTVTGRAQPVLERELRRI